MNFAIIVAAGQSVRMNGLNKILTPVLKKPVIYYTLLAFEKHPQIRGIILVGRKEDLKKLSQIVKKYQISKVKEIKEGGKERQDSVFAGFWQLKKKFKIKEDDLILIHNGANPLVSEIEITEAISAAKIYGASVVANPVKDTIKIVDKNLMVLKTLARKSLWAMQTPQVIAAGLAEKALGKAKKEGFYATDDVALVEFLGKPVKIVPGSFNNIKITTPEDLKTVKNILKERND